MNILYVTNESPILPKGGIGTYLLYTARAMAQAGHNVYLLTWTYEDVPQTISYSPFTPETVRILRVIGRNVWLQYPNGPYDHAFSNFLSTELSQCVEEWNIDVVEAADYLSPALAFFQDFQSRSSKRNVLCVTYNHGFIEDFYEADQIMPKRDAQDDLVGERQQCRVSDLIVAPSTAAVRRLANYGIVDNVHMVREPYEFVTEAALSQVKHSLTYIGRISIAKGIDTLILFANQIHPVFPVGQILLIGKEVNPPFRTNDIRQYVWGRLHKTLASTVVFMGSLKRETALGMLVPGAISPSLGYAETFSYACIETIDCGLVPVVRHGTPMAEFFPADLSEYIFEEDLSNCRAIQTRFAKLVANAPTVVADLQAYNKEKLAPSVIAGQMSDLYDAGLRAKRGYRALTLRKPATIADVTVLIPAYRPENIFAETVDSIAAQTAGVPSVLICDDGTPDDERSWFDYAASMLPECRIVEQPNNGLLGARNTLIRECGTRLSLFVDADDILSPRFLERTLEAYNSSVFRPDAIVTHRRNFGENSDFVIRNMLGDHIHLLRNDMRMTALIETDVLRDIGFDLTRRNGEGDDWAFWLEFMAAGYRSVLVPQTLFHYRFREGSMSWPWSMGQASGTHTMVRKAMTTLCNRRPRETSQVVRALHSVTTVHIG